MSSQNDSYVNDVAGLAVSLVAGILLLVFLIYRQISSMLTKRRLQAAMLQSEKKRESQSLSLAQRRPVESQDSQQQQEESEASPMQFKIHPKTSVKERTPIKRQESEVSSEESREQELESKQRYLAVTQEEDRAPTIRTSEEAFAQLETRLDDLTEELQAQPTQSFFTPQLEKPKVSYESAYTTVKPRQPRFEENEEEDNAGVGNAEVEDVEETEATPIKAKSSKGEERASHLQDLLNQEYDEEDSAEDSEYKEEDKAQESSDDEISEEGELSAEDEEPALNEKQVEKVITPPKSIKIKSPAKKSPAKMITKEEKENASPQIQQFATPTPKKTAKSRKSEVQNLMDKKNKTDVKTPQRSLRDRKSIKTPVRFIEEMGESHFFKKTKN